MIDETILRLMIDGNIAEREATARVKLILFFFVNIFILFLKSFK